MTTDANQNVNNSGTLLTVAFKILKRVNRVPLYVHYVDGITSRQPSSAFGNTFIINKRI